MSKSFNLNYNFQPTRDTLHIWHAYCTYELKHCTSRSFTLTVTFLKSCAEFCHIRRNQCFTNTFCYRAVNILPNRFIGVVGEHEDFPVENLSLSRDKTFIASCSHDQTIKFWNVEEIKEEQVSTKKKAKKTNKPKYMKSAAKDNFFAGLAEEGESSKTDDKDDDKDDEDDSDDDDEDDDKDSDSSEND